MMVALALSTNPHPQDRYKYVVRGRAINEHGKPVANASVVVIPSLSISPNRSAINVDQADAEGDFRVEQGESTLDTRKRLLYLTDPLPANAIALIWPPFDQFPELTEPAYVGRQILITKNGDVDVGDQLVQVHYGSVKVLLQDHLGRPISIDQEGWRAVWLRVRNFRGQTVAESTLSINDIKKVVKPAESSIVLALPQGTWYIEASVEGDKGPWLTALPTVVSGSSLHELVLKVR